jgi:hypothetical protein
MKQVKNLFWPLLFCLLVLALVTPLDVFAQASSDVSYRYPDLRLTPIPETGNWAFKVEMYPLGGGDLIDTNWVVPRDKVLSWVGVPPGTEVTEVNVFGNEIPKFARHTAMPTPVKEKLIEQAVGQLPARERAIVEQAMRAELGLPPPEQQRPPADTTQGTGQEGQQGAAGAGQRGIKRKGGGQGLIPCGTGAQDFCKRLCDVLEVGKKLYDILVGLGGIAAVAALLVGALQMMLAGSPDMAERGKTAVRAAIVGLIILLVSWLLVNTVIAILGGGGIGSRINVCQDSKIIVIFNYENFRKVRKFETPCGAPWTTATDGARIGDTGECSSS